MDAESGGSSPALDTEDLHLGESASDPTRTVPGQGGSFPDTAVRRVGPWKVDRLLGVGGMGAVYLADRADGELERRAAIKVIRAGITGSAVSTRFRAERQILASLDHPNIARMYDAGTLPDGRPYMVLEYVDGCRIDEYCRRHGLSMSRRLELFRKICSAVSHAHRHLVIHRDLKPSNILVDSQGEPKLLDFGIAKLLDAESFPLSLEETQTGVRPMTPRYASPEQIRGQAVSTSSDVFALGVLLYELLTGALPFVYSTKSAVAMDEVLRTTRPRRPSTAINGPAIGLDERSLRRGKSLLKGDLDNIVLKALREEPSKRYGSVEALQQDLNQLASGRPVSATRDTLGYVAKKFLRRHRLGVAALAFILGVLSGSTWLISKQAEEASMERDRARSENARAHRMLDFLVDTFDVVDRNAGLGRSVTAKEILDEAILRVDQNLQQDADAQVRLFRTIGSIYKRLGQTEQAWSSLQQSLTLAEQHLGEGHEQTLETILELGDLSESMVRNREAIHWRQTAVERSRAHLRPDHPLLARSLVAHAAIEFAFQRLDSAEAAVREAIGILAQQPVLEVEADIEARGLLARIELGRGAPESAEQLFQQSLEQAKAGLGEQSYWAAIAHQDLGDLYMYLQRVDEAAEHYQQCYDIGSKSYARSPTFVAVTLRRLGRVAQTRGDLDEALRRFEESISHSQALADSNPDNVLFNAGLVITRRLAASVAEEMGDADAAFAHYEAALEPSRRAMATDSVSSRYAHAVILARTGRKEEARRIVEDLKEEASVSPETREILERVDLDAIVED